MKKINTKKIKRRKDIPFYVRIAEAIVFFEIFDIILNEGSFSNIHELIAHKMLELEGLSQKARYILWPEYVWQVKNSLHEATKYLEEQGIFVYKIRPTRNIQVLTTLAHYKEAREKDLKRELKNARQSSENFKNNIIIKHPTYIDDIVPALEHYEDSLNQVEEKTEERIEKLVVRRQPKRIKD